MLKKKIDYIILGGGCSALNLAVELSKKKIKDLSFLIIERRRKYTDDRSWCFWDHKTNKNKDLISKSWKKFSFSFNSKRIISKSTEFNYHYIRSIDFYNYAIENIKKTENISLNLGENVFEIIENRGNFIVKSNKNTYFARNILDTRPKNDMFQESPLLFQSFLGFEINLKKNKHANDTVGIMENMRSNEGNFLFDYILPIRKDSILVEVTSFSKTPLSSKQMEDYLEKSLKNNNFLDYKVTRKEYGVIPMGFLKKRSFNKNNNYFFGGSLGGAVRPSSGYAFLRIQKWAEDAANMLKNEKKLISHPRDNIIIYFLDRIFLKVLERKISLAPFIFFTFFQRISITSFLRFMNGNANLSDYLKVIYAMPKKYFLRKSLWK